MYKAPNLPSDKHCFFGKDKFLYSEDGRYWQSKAREKISTNLLVVSRFLPVKR